MYKFARHEYWEASPHYSIYGDFCTILLIICTAILLQDLHLQLLQTHIYKLSNIAVSPTTISPGTLPASYVPSIASITFSGSGVIFVNYVYNQHNPGKDEEHHLTIP
jgi:hypothetical protein